MITVSEIQDILGIEGNDTQIENLIPIALSYAFDFTNNYFHTYEKIAPAEFSNNKLKMDLDYQLNVGNFIHIEDSVFNDGVYEVKSSDDNQYGLDTDLDDEFSLISLAVMKVPQGFKIAIAKFIGSLISGTDKKSESIGDYSYSNTTTQELLNEYFSQYKQIKVV